MFFTLCYYTAMPYIVWLTPELMEEFSEIEYGWNFSQYYDEYGQWCAVFCVRGWGFIVIW